MGRKREVSLVMMALVAGFVSGVVSSRLLAGSLVFAQKEPEIIRAEGFALVGHRTMFTLTGGIGVEGARPLLREWLFGCYHFAGRVFSNRRTSPRSLSRLAARLFLIKSSRLMIGVSIPEIFPIFRLVHASAKITPLIPVSRSIRFGATPSWMT